MAKPSWFLIPVLVSPLWAEEPVAFLPRLLVSQTYFAFNTSSASTTPAAKTLFWTHNGEPFEVSAAASTTSGGDWLAVEPQPAQPLNAFRISVRRGTLGPGTYTGNVVLTPTAADAPPQQLDVSLTVYVSDTRNQITALTSEELVWGQDVGIVVSAAGALSGLNSLDVSPSDGLEIGPVEITTRLILGFLSVSTATFRIKVHDEAPESDRTVTLSGNSGTTNALTLRIRRPSPFIVTATPSVLQPGRLYFTKSHPTGTPPSFVWNGIDLDASDTFFISPPVARMYLSAVGLYPTKTAINGFVLVAPDAPSDTLDFRFLAPFRGEFGTSLKIEAPPSTAPLISDLNLSESENQFSGIIGGEAIYSGSFRLEDSDGDIKAETLRIRMAVLVTNASQSYASAVDASHGRSQNWPGPGATDADIRIEGDTAKFTIKVRYPLSLLTARGSLPIAVSVVDEAGNLSNTLISEKRIWHIPIF